jgi:hypothetical protein
MEGIYNRRLDGKPDLTIRNNNSNPPSQGPKLNEKYMTRNLVESREEAIESIQKLLDKRR